MTVLVIRGDARRLPLPDVSADLIVTSPPYFALRSYTDGGEHYPGQIGSEATPAEFLDALWACTAEWVRVLKPTGSLWVNLGDKYAERAGPERLPDVASDETVRRPAMRPRRRGERETGVRQKSLMGLPWRYAIGCIDQLGLILRAEVVWSKPNGLPESVTDRVRRSHEQWFHFTARPRYYSAVDEIREPSDPRNLRPADVRGEQSVKDRARRESGHGTVGRPGVPLALNPLGKLPGSVWEIPSEPLTVPAELDVDHFAAFPTEWPRRLILGWSPPGICTACGEGRRPVADRAPMLWRESPTIAGRTAPGASRKPASGTMLSAAETRIIGYSCACPDPSAPTRPAVVLDPFGGTGTTALVAHALGRTGITVDLSADYCRLARWRTTDPDQLAKAMRVRKPPKQVDGQAGLF